MTERIRTLLLEANGVRRKAVIADTVLEGMLGIRSGRALPGSVARVALLRKLVGQRYESLSYAVDWRDAILRSPDLEVERCNITNLLALRRAMRSIRDYDLIIVLHSAAGDSVSLISRGIAALQARRGTLAVFIGNEYDELAEKTAFLRAVEADVICTQLPLDAARELYRECPASRLLAMPHALNPSIYHPRPEIDRVIDIGFVGDLYHCVIGDTERTDLVLHLERHARELGVRFDRRTRRMPREEWAHYLCSCHGVAGAESGTYYLDRDGHSVALAKAYMRAHPSASFEEVFENSFGLCGEHVSGKAISSRHFEPLGTRTCQVLLRGRYNDILEAGVHYIAVDRDLANIEDAIARFRDPSERQAVAERGFEHAMAHHTYDHRIRHLVEAVSTASAARPCDP